ncbi:hypothetical protein L0U85_09930 [Glycomyces sp. L485]|uniref:hypothetical protein n=1 Tax=Glycomyces sp. L485 TaxID=2909235 RepID=UPI001F4AC364|nr:hypothetical protein [Glycomyces sp. L485]MCH7231168.1 hypothetical protein [Glycomyces sp. L485]
MNTDGLLDRLPGTVLGVFEVQPFTYAIEDAGPDVARVNLVNVAEKLTPLAEVVHDHGRVVGMVCRDLWKSTPADRKRQWRLEAARILAGAAADGKL